MYDLVIIGSGPSGLAAALSAKRQGLDFLIIERGELAQTVRNYPLGKSLFSTSNEVELEPGALPGDRKPTREEVLRHYETLVKNQQLNIHTNEAVESITPTAQGFIIKTSKGDYLSRTVLVAVGGFGRQRRLQVPGESDDRVAYRFVEGAGYANQDVLVVGGGNSAAEATLFLLEFDARPIWILRRAAIDLAPDPDTGASRAKIKPWVREPIEKAQAAGLIQIITSAKLLEIRPQTAVLERLDCGEQLEINCHHILALIGADPDTTLLETAGVEIAPDGRPVYNTDTYETTVPGLYVAGHITRELHMKNAIEVTPRIVDNLAAQWFAQAMG
ncbi:MAG: NAD(P)-binding domain-containing protein [Acidobacteriota bacterium]